MTYFAPDARYYDVGGIPLEEKDRTNDSKLLKSIHRQVHKVAENIDRTQIADYVQLMNSPKKLVWTNMLAGLSRGVGFAIGFTIFATTILYLLRALGALNLPIVGGYIADIVRHVQYQLEGRAF
jgi:hypothetical protein